MENVEKWILCFASYDQSKLYIFQEFWFAVAENDLAFDVSRHGAQAVWQDLRDSCTQVQPRDTKTTNIC